MGKRYYCDYCDRSFQDTLHNRKKHLNGVQHHRAKKAWFDHFRDSASILQDERTKQPCRKFLQTGQCGFGPNCRYSHMSEHDRMILEQQIEDERWQNSNQGKSFKEPSLDEWLLRREKKKVVTTSGSTLKLDEVLAADICEVPHFLLSIPDLPPSLVPAPPAAWRDAIHTDWG